MDAIAYIYKQSGTVCINHEKTHKFVKIFRLINDIMTKGSTLITETNLPNQENLSYFETQMKQIAFIIFRYRH